MLDLSVGNFVAFIITACSINVADNGIYIILTPGVGYTRPQADSTSLCPISPAHKTHRS
jgi:hypothetical protein